MMRYIVILLLTLASLGGGGRPVMAVTNAIRRPLSVTVVDGHDFALPPRVQPSERSGVFVMGTVRIRADAQTAIGGTTTWSELNPRDGVYDFSRIRTFLEKVRVRGCRAVIRVKGLVVERSKRYGSPERIGPFVPQWVLDKHNPPEFETRNRDLQYIRVAAPWDPGLDAEYRAFVKQFGKAGFLADPTLGGLYVHGFSSSGGEEFWLSRRGDYTKQAKAAGMTESRLNATFRRRIDDWAEAAGEHVYKLAWVEFGGIHALDWDAAPLNAYALERGLGWRQGGLESYFWHAPPVHGQRWEDGYVSVDFNHPLRDGRYFGEEIECSLPALYPSISPTLEMHVARSSIMRAAQLGMNYLWTSYDMLATAPAMWRWFSRVAGKGPAEAPDAMCWLREDLCPPNRFVSGRTRHGHRLWKNLERFLYQRDYADGFTTVPVEPISRATLRLPAGRRPNDFAARRTDRQSGNDTMLFFLEDAFRKQVTGAFRIAVMYRDRGTCEWELLVGTDTGVRHSERQQCTGSGAWRTAMVNVPDPPDRTHLPHQADFAIRVLDHGDLTVQFVRVLR